VAKISRDFLYRHLKTFALLVVVVAAVVLYVRDAPANPPGFHVDESSVAYNAHLISRTGRDEHGQAWPLFFRAFGEYKNPIHIYFLAAVFRVTGPGIAVARVWSAILGLLTVLLIGLLGARVSGRREVGVLVGATALLTPWLFELSRVVVEVALYPLAVALFLFCVRRASEKPKWNWTDALALSATLALLTYSYTIGRVLGPLLALGLALFITRTRLRVLLLTWAAYSLSLVPILVFHLRHPGALDSRFRILSYINPQSRYVDDAWEFAKHYVGNLNPWWMTVAGDPNSDQIASIYGNAPVLAVTFLLSIIGIVLLMRRERLEPWWRFVVFGLAASFVPAALTIDYFHTLRLCAVPVFLITLTIPAFAWLVKTGTFRRRALLTTAIVLTLAQGLVFQWRHHTSAQDRHRMKVFDADYATTILPMAMAASGSRPIYIADAPAIPDYIHAFWYATVQQAPLEKFVRLAPDEGAPEGSVVISTENTCPRCRRLFERDPFTVYIAEGAPRKLAPLPLTGFRAEIRALNSPTRLGARQISTIRVVVKNISEVVWLARERTAAQFQLSLGNHWLDKNGQTVANDDGRASILRDLQPGEETELILRINAPQTPGEYLLEIDMLQENVSWFGLRGSKTIRLPVKVERQWFD
jgi:hypothetical protein